MRMLLMDGTGRGEGETLQMKHDDGRQAPDVQLLEAVVAALVAMGACPVGYEVTADILLQALVEATHGGGSCDEATAVTAADRAGALVLASAGARRRRITHTAKLVRQR